MNDQEINDFLSGQAFAVAGASQDRSKYGNKVLRALQQLKKNVVAIHPVATEVEGTQGYKTLEDVPHPIDRLSIVTPPVVTAKIVDQAIELGVHGIWMQPGAEHEEAIEKAKAAGILVIHGGPCLLVAARYRE